MRLVRIYPSAWRARYGDELEALIEQLDGGARMSYRDRLDLVRAGLVERARALGASGLPPRERALEGSVLVLYAWVMFVLGGFGVQKTSEHWRAFTPPGEQALPAAAFDVLVIAAGVGSALVLIGLAITFPRLVGLRRRAAWAEVRRPLIRAASLSLLTVVATIGLVTWAHSLTPLARNGHHATYTGAFLAWAVLLAACLFSWVAAAAAAARRLALPERLLRVEVWLAAATSATMVVMTAAAGAWWGSLAGAAPWFFAGRPPGSNASPIAANMVVAVALMSCAALLGALGAIRATKALAALPATRSRR